MSNAIKVVDIKWDKMYLTICTDRMLDEDEEFFAINKSNNKVINIISEILDNNWIINITTFSGREVLDAGDWILFTKDKKEIKNFLTLDSRLLYEIANYARFFYYGQGKFAYLVSLFVHGDADHYLGVRTSMMMINTKYKKTRYLANVRGVEGFIRALGRKLFHAYVAISYSIQVKLSRKKGNRVLFLSTKRQDLSINLQKLLDRAKERKLDKDFSLNTIVLDYVSPTKRFFWLLKAVNEIAKSDYVFMDNVLAILDNLNLDKKTTIIQVWHAGVGFKRIGYSSFGSYDMGLDIINSRFRKHDYIVVGSKGIVPIYKEVFGIPEDSAYLPYGLPRLDGYLDKIVISDFRNEFYANNEQLKNKKIILFAPTFRGESNNKAYYEYDQIDYEKLADICIKKNYVVLFKMHPYILEPVPIPEEYNDCLFDFSKFKDINELFYVTDILITDYSSCIYEFALFNKPILFYVYDKENYEISRGMHQSIDETAPGKICNTFDELITAIDKEDYEVRKLKKYRDFAFDNYEGNACDAIIDRVLLRKNA